MYLKIKYIILFVLLVFSCYNVNASADNYNVEDTLDVQEPEKWYKKIREFRENAKDTIAVAKYKQEYGDDFWKLAALSGKLDLKDETVKYPRFVKWCVDLYNWGDNTFNSYDSAYVVGTGKRMKLTLKNDNWMDFYDLKLPKSISVGMSSDMSSNLSASLSYMALSFSYAMNLDYLFAGKPVAHRRYDLSFTCSLIAFDAYYSKNTGNTNLTYLGDTYRNYNIFKSEHKFSGLTLESAGIDAYYFFNNKKYSQAAAYSYSKYQKRSAGSFIGGLTFSRQNVKFDFNALPEDVVKELSSDQRNYHVFYRDYCVMFGYGYNWVFRKNWLFNFTIIPCLGFNQSMNNTEERRKDMFSYNTKAKFALVYNHNNFFYSVNGRFDGHYYNTDKYRFFNSYTNLAFIAGIRF